MYIYKVIAKVERETVGMFDNKVHVQTDTTERYLAAYSCEHAINFVESDLKRVNWKVLDITAKEIFLLDIRDSCDRITDFD